MSRSPPVGTSTAPVLVPSMPTVPIVAGSTPHGAVRLATVLPMSPMAKVNGQGPAPGFVERIPSNVSKAGGQLKKYG